MPVFPVHYVDSKNVCTGFNSRPSNCVYKHFFFINYQLTVYIAERERLNCGHNLNKEELQKWRQRACFSFFFGGPPSYCCRKAEASLSAGFRALVCSDTDIRCIRRVGL